MTAMRKRIVSAVAGACMAAGAAACAGSPTASDLTMPDVAAPKDTSGMIPVSPPPRTP